MMSGCLDPFTHSAAGRIRGGLGSGFSADIASVVDQQTGHDDASCSRVPQDLGRVDDPRAGSCR